MGQMCQMAERMNVYFRPKKGQSVAGDCYLKDQVDSTTRYVVIDPLGHGEQAASVARQALDLLDNLKVTQLEQIIAHCHTQFKSTRGLAMSFAFYDNATRAMSIAIIGNVNVIVLTDDSVVQFRASQTFIGNMYAQKISLQSYDVCQKAKLLIFTDGIQYPSKSQLNLFCGMTPRHILQALSDEWNGQDDVGILCEYIENE